MWEGVSDEMATLTNSGVCRESMGSCRLCASVVRMSTMWAPLSINAFTGKESVAPVSEQFQVRCLHFNGGGTLTDGRLLSEPSEKQTSSSSSKSGKTAATRFGLSDGVGNASATTPTVVPFRVFFWAFARRAS
jgi:hypothetical protein